MNLEIKTDHQKQIVSLALFREQGDLEERLTTGTYKTMEDLEYEQKCLADVKSLLEDPIFDYF